MAKMGFSLRLSVLALLALLTACGGGTGGTTSSARLSSDVVTEEFFLQAKDEDLKLYLRNKHPADYYAPRSDRTILLLHGALFSGSATFDLPVDGVSWMDWLAKRGYDVYSLDIRGYGKSSRPAAMKTDANGTNPVVDTASAVRDVSKAVDFIVSRRNLDKLSLVGWSWGAGVAGAYTNEVANRVERLVLLAPQWLRDLPPSKEQPTLTTWRSIPYTTVRDHLLQTETSKERGSLMSAATIDAWIAAVRATEPDGPNGTMLKFPGGPYADMIRYWSAKQPLWRPDRVQVPTLVVQGEADTDIPPDMGLSVFAQLTNSPTRRFVLLGDASHPMMLERNRQHMFRTVQSFLDERF